MRAYDVKISRLSRRTPSIHHHGNRRCDTSFVEVLQRRLVSVAGHLNSHLRSRALCFMHNLQAKPGALGWASLLSSDFFPNQVWFSFLHNRFRGNAHAKHILLSVFALSLYMFSPCLLLQAPNTLSQYKIRSCCSNAWESPFV